MTGEEPTNESVISDTFNKLKLRKQRLKNEALR